MTEATAAAAAGDLPKQMKCATEDDIRVPVLADRYLCVRETQRRTVREGRGESQGSHPSVFVQITHQEIQFTTNGSMVLYLGYYASKGRFYCVKSTFFIFYGCGLIPREPWEAGESPTSD